VIFSKILNHLWIKIKPKKYLNPKNMFKNAVTLVCMLLYFSNSYAQLCITPPLGSEACSGAPLVGCNLDGYVGSSASYTASTQPFGFCGIVENNQFLSFYADESPIQIQITPYNCTNNEGLQAVIYQTTDCNTLSPVSNCSSFGYENDLLVEVNPAVVGDLYYLMIDGFEGDVCDFSISVLSGITSDIIATASNSQVCLGSTTDLDGTGSSTGTNIAYLWTASNGGNIVSGENTLTPTVNQPGDYNLLVVDTIECCTNDITISVSEDTNFPTIATSVNDVLDCNTSLVTLDGTGSATGTFSYEWTTSNGNVFGSSNTINAAADEPGDYTLTISNTTTGCSSSESIAVTIDTISPNASASALSMITCTNTSVNLQGSSTTSGVTYEWNGPNGFNNTNNNTSNNESGNYLFLVTAPNGCTQSVAVEIEEDITPPNVSANVTEDLDCDTNQITLNGGSTTTGATYEWTGVNSFSSTQSSPSASDAGSYTLEVTGLNGCTATQSVTVNEDYSKPNVSAQANEILDCTNTEVDILGSTTTANSSLSWSGPNGFNSTLTAPTVNEPGGYTLTVTAANGCTAEEMITVIQDTNVPTSDAGLDQTLTCSSTQVNIGGTNSSTGSDFEYEWFDDNGVSLGTSVSVPVSSTGIYELVVTNTANDCSSVSTVEVDENIISPNAEAGLPQTITCSNPSLTLDGTNTTVGNFTYVWQNSSGSTIATTGSTSISNQGTYQLIVTDTDNGCTNNDTVLIDENITTPSADAGANEELTCATTQITLDASNSSTGTNFTYEWQTSTGTSLGNNSTQNVNQVDDYQLIVTNTTNGCTMTDVVSISQDIQAPTSDAGASPTITCIAGEVVVDGSGSSTGIDFTYEWQNSGGVIVGTTVDPLVNSAGMYDLIVTDNSNGCTALASVEVLADEDTPTASAGMTQSITCTMSLVTLDGSSSSTGSEFTYEWQDEDDNTVSSSQNPITNQSGIYTIIVTDSSNGCTAESSVNIVEDIQTPTVATAASDELTCNLTSVYVDGSSSSTGSDFSYAWTNSTGTLLGTDITEEVTSPGNYTLVVTDDTNGCTATNTINVNQDISAPSVSAGSNMTLTCTETAIELDGSLSSSGPEFQYQWSDDLGNIISSEINPTVNYTSIYELMVTNISNGCTSTATTLVAQNIQTPTVDNTISGTLNCTDEELTLGIGNSSKGTNFQYEWENSTGTIIGGEDEVVVNQADTYTLTILDTNNGCEESAQVSIIQDTNLPTANAGANTELTCYNETITLDGINSTANGTLSYQWQDSDGAIIGADQQITVEEEDIYTLIVEDTNNGCTAQSTVSITNNMNTPQITINPLQELTCSRTQVNITSDVFLSGGSIDYSWTNELGSNISTSSEINVTSPGEYQLLVTNPDNGCTQAQTVEVFEDIETPNATAGIDSAINCYQNEIFLDGSASSIGTEFTYLWTDSQGTIISTDINFETQNPENYSLKVTNTKNGCTAMDEVFVADNRNFPTASITGGNILTCAEGATTLDATDSSVNENISLEWKNSNGELVGTEEYLLVNQADTYTLKVKNLDNGCETTDELAIEENKTAPEADINPPLNITCVNTDVPLVGLVATTNNIDLSWQDENGNTLGTTSNIVVDEEGVYDLLLTNTVNGCTTVESVEVFEDKEIPSADAGPDDVITCIKDAIDLIATTSNTTTHEVEWLNEMGQVISTNFEYEVQTPGMYDLIITNTVNGCTNTDEILITENRTLPEAVIESDGALITCDQTTVVIDGNNSMSSSILSFTWLDMDGNLISNTNEISTETPGTFNLIVTNLDNGCDDQSSIIIGEDTEKPILDIAPVDILTCTENSANLFAEITNSNSSTNFTYDWTTTNGNITSSSTIQTPTINQAGTYHVIVRNDANGCTDEGVVLVEADQELPIAELRIESELDCITTSVEIDGIGSSTGNEFIYNWTGANVIANGNTLTPTVGESGAYTLLITNVDNGCTTSESIEVMKNEASPTDAMIEVDDPACPGDLGVMGIYDVIGGTAPYLYSFDEGDFADQDLFQQLEPGLYDLTIQDAIGCEWDTTLLISIPESIEVDLEEDEVTIKLGESLNIQASLYGNATDINWTVEGELQGEQDLSLEVTPLETTTYNIEVANENGCVSTDQIVVKIDKKRSIFIPNAFSPNNDGVNDVFMVYSGVGVESIKKFWVFDRWGEQLYTRLDIQPNDLEAGWDGTHRGQTMQQGVYVYVAEVQFIDGTIEMFKGDVTIK